MCEFRQNGFINLSLNWMVTYLNRMILHSGRRIINVLRTSYSCIIQKKTNLADTTNNSFYIIIYIYSSDRIVEYVYSSSFDKMVNALIYVIGVAIISYFRRF